MASAAPINLSKGERINLSKAQPGLKEIRIGLKWLLKPGQTADLDASVVLLGADDKMVKGGEPNTPRGLCYYTNPSLPGIEHKGDAKFGGDGEADNETIIIKLDEVASDAQALLIVCTSYNPEVETNPNCAPILFGQVAKPKITIYNNTNGEALYTFELDEDASAVTAAELGRLYRKDGDWRFTGLGEGHGKAPNGLANIISKWYE
jgi:tellurium resistance protein TerD